jgi:septal ring factor EnvC (AmiA/AmiB activator)
MGEDRMVLKGMLDVLQDHENQVKAVEEKFNIVKRLESEESRQLSQLKEGLNKKVLLLMKIHKEKEFYETAVKELNIAANKLKETLNGLEKKTKKQVKLKSDFAEYKGNLNLPYEGKIIRDFHPLGTGPGMTHQGIFIKGKERGAVKAIYDGRVDYSGWLKGYGQIVIINHGSRFFSVSAHLSERKLDKGDMVCKGDIVGLAGESGSLSGPGLYFELRRAGEPLEPLKWLKGR